MPLTKFPGNILGVGFNPLQAPNAPTSVTAAGGAPDSGEASVSFTAPANVGGSAITGYTGRSTPDNVAATASASPLTFSGLTIGTSYTFNVWALNSYGPSPAGGPSGAVSPTAVTGLFGGGFTSGFVNLNVISYISISTLGDATDFGDLTSATYSLAACSSSTRGLFGGGSTGSRVNTIEYVTIATVGNATDFGDLTTATQALAACSSSTRGLFGGGFVSGDGSSVNTIEYVTIATVGNATDFGDLTLARSGPASCSSSTRGVFIGGRVPAPDYYTNTMDYVTIATTGNATDFGDVAGRGGASTEGGSACSNSTRGLLGGGSGDGSSRTNYIDYITIATTGNTTFFGSLTNSLESTPGACASPTRATWAGGNNGVFVNVIQYVTIATTGNATDFGDLTQPSGSLAGCSNGHGGL